MAGTADVLIAGGGVAGASLAIMLGRAGLNVELYDRRRFPRDKPCGEGLMPAGVAVLRRLGLDSAVVGRELRGVRYHGYGIRADAEFPLPLAAGELGGGGAHADADADGERGGAERPVALGVRRLHLDRVLFEAALATPGVRAFEGKSVEGAVLEGERAVGLRVGGATRRAPLVIGADGARSAVRRSLGLERPEPRRFRAGVRRHFRLSPAAVRAGLQPDVIEIFVAPDHELYVTPLPDNQILIAALADGETLTTSDRPGGNAAVRARFAGWIAAQPILRARLEGARPVSPLGGRAPLCSSARTGVAPGAVLLGDAAGFIDPITAGGMAQALSTAELLVPYVVGALADGGARGDTWLRRFERQRRRLLLDYEILTRVLLFLVQRPALARTTLRLMRAHPRLMSHLVGVAGGLRRLLPPVLAVKGEVLTTTAAERPLPSPPPSAPVRRRLPPAPPRLPAPAGGAEVLDDGPGQVVQVHDIGGEAAPVAVRPDGV